MKHLMIAVFALSTGLALAIPASAERGKGVCAEDVAKFCKDVKPGEGRVAACLKEHEKNLSKACRERQTLKGEKRTKRGKRAGKHGVRAGESGKGNKAWARGYADGFARGYEKARKARGKRGIKKGTRNRLAKVCAEDVKKLCGDVKPGKGNVRDCLIKNMKKLSDGCKARTEKVKERTEKRGKKA